MSFRHTTLAFSLLEALVALGLVTGVAAAAYAVFKPTWTGGQVSQEVARLEQLRRTIPGAYASAANFMGITNDPILATDIQPSPWGSFALQPATVDAPSDGWSASYAAVPTAACEALINAEMGREWTSISIDANPIADAPQGVNQCATSDAHTMQFVMWGGLRGMNGIGVLMPPGYPPRQPGPPGLPTPPVPVPVWPTAPAPGAPTMPTGGPPPAPSPPAAPAPPIPSPPPVAPAPGYPPVCSPPAPQQQPAACPSGEIQSVPPYGADGIIDQRDATCPWRYAGPVWGAWYAEANTCAPICAAPAAQSQAVACPSGQISSVSPYSADGVTQKRTASCPAPTGSYVWSAWSQTGTTCASVCTAPPTTTATVDRWESTSPGCPAGQVGTYSYQYEQAQTNTTSWHCPAPTGSATSTLTPGAWNNTGQTQDVVNTCAPAIPPPASYTNEQVCATFGVNVPGGCAAGAGVSVFVSGGFQVWTGGSFTVTINYNGASQTVTTYQVYPPSTYTVGGGTFSVSVDPEISNDCPAANPAFAGSCIDRVSGTVTGP